MLILKLVTLVAPCSSLYVMFHFHPSRHKYVLFCDCNLKKLKNSWLCKLWINETIRMKLVKQVTPLAKRNPSQSEELLNTNMRQKSKELQNLICRCRILTSGASYPPTTRQLKDRGAICLPKYLQRSKLYMNLILILNLKRRHY
jgi:hypothetical protein